MSILSASDGLYTMMLILLYYYIMKLNVLSESKLKTICAASYFSGLALDALFSSLFKCSHCVSGTIDYEVSQTLG
jgi:hypothetical protein